MPYAPEHVEAEQQVSSGKPVAGNVWVSWLLEPAGWQGPAAQIRQEKEQGIYYEYRVLRDGDKVWKHFLVEDTKLRGVEIVNGIYRQRRGYLVRGLDPHGVYSFCVRAVNAVGTSTDPCDLTKVTPVFTEHNELPRTVSLEQNYPNPFKSGDDRNVHAEPCRSGSTVRVRSDWAHRIHTCGRRTACWTP